MTMMELTPLIRSACARKGRTLTKSERREIRELANKPPKGANPRSWAEVVVRGFHTTYAGAFVHYRNAVKKYGPAAAPSKSIFTPAPPMSAPVWF